jgi:penicillin-binding protein 2
MRILGVVGVSLFVALFGRLWYLQALQAEELQEVATLNIQETIRTQAPRGRVLDINGNVLVDNRLSTIVTVNPEDLRIALVEQGVRDADDQKEFRLEMFTELARELSGSGQLTKLADLERAFNDPSFRRFEDIPVARDVDEELLIFIGERPNRFPGVKVEQDLVREYPYGARAAHILGYVGSITGAELEAKADRWTVVDPVNPENRLPDPFGKPYRSNDEIGKEGIERFFEDDLRGIPGTQVIEVDNFGNLVDIISSEAPQRGSDIMLTIDIDLQVELEDELKRALDRAREAEPAQPDDPSFNAPAGAAVIMDPRNGSVLAMASYPTFDPGDFIDGLSFDQKAALDDPTAHQPLLNRAVAEIYPAASTFKPFTAIAAEEYDVFGWDFVEEWDVPTSDPGYWDLKSCGLDSDDRETALALGCRKRNAGDATMEGVDLEHSIAFSSDTYYYKLGEAFWIAPNDEIPDDGIQRIASQFGLGASTGIQLPGEKSGLMPTADLKQQRHEDNPEAFPFGDWYSGDNANIAIGQGDIAITPLQLTNAYAALANGGTVFSPNIVSEIRPPERVELDELGNVVEDEDGKPVVVEFEPIEFAPRVIREIDIPPDVQSAILDGLLGVTMLEKTLIDRPGGTAFDAFNEPDTGGVDFDLVNWPVAGKTGTAQVGNGIDIADNAMFAGFGPSGSTNWGTAVSEPEFVMVTILEESGFGSKSAAPFVARMFDLIATDEVPKALRQEEIDEFYGVTNIGELAAPEQGPAEAPADGTDG